MTSNPDFAATARLGQVQLSDDDIQRAELARARHALAYLKAKLGNEAMRSLLASDLARMQAQVGSWVEASGGAWQTGLVELTVPGPPAAAFHQWYTAMLAHDREATMRAGHPEHFVSHPRPGQATEVIENIGETALPWQVFYQLVPDAELPAAWDPAYPVRFGMALLDASRRRVGYSMHQLRDAADGMHLQLRTFLPAAAPAGLVGRHLHHFAIEFRNWTHAAWRELAATAHAA